MPAAKSPAVSPTSPGAAPMSNAVYLMKLVFVVAGLYACFFSWGVVHEKIAAHQYVVDGKPTRFSSFLVTTMIVSLSTVLVASACLVGLAIVGYPAKLVAIRKKHLCVTVGVTATFAAPLSLNAAKHLSYPVFLTVKMCKMIPSVIVGRLWYGARYSLLKYVAVVAITSGVVAFSMLSSRGDTEEAVTTSSDFVLAGVRFDPVRVVAVVIAFVGMTLDGYTVSTQDELNAQAPGMPSLQLMLICGLSQAAWCAVALLVGELLPSALHTPLVKPEVFSALHFFRHAPQALIDSVLLGVLNAAGQVFLFYGLGIFGGLTVVALMTTRKIGSVFISIAVHGHTIAFEQWFALLAVVLGVVVDTVDGIRTKNRKAKAKTEKKRA